MSFESKAVHTNPAARGNPGAAGKKPPHQEAPRVSTSHSGGFTGGTPGSSHGMTGGISPRYPVGPDGKIKLSGGIG